MSLLSMMAEALYSVKPTPLQPFRHPNIGICAVIGWFKTKDHYVILYTLKYKFYERK